MRYQRLALVGAVVAVSFVVTIQLRSSTCRRTDLATILANSVVLLQTRALAEPTEAGLS